MFKNRKKNMVGGGRVLGNLKTGMCHYPLDGKPCAWIFRAHLKTCSLPRTCRAINGEVFLFCPDDNTLHKREV